MFCTIKYTGAFKMTTWCSVKECEIHYHVLSSALNCNIIIYKDFA